MLVSIVMAVFNGQDFLQEAIDSILSQTYSEIEVIIVNDASTDGTVDILRGILDHRVKVIDLKRNRGGAYALKVGIREAKGEWIAIHDADDVSYPNRIKEQVDYIKFNSGLVAVGSFVEVIHGASPLPQLSLDILEGFINRDQTTEELRIELYSRCSITHGTMIFSKKAYLEAGEYSSHFQVSYDYDLWTRLVLQGPIKKIPKKLYKYRLHDESLTNKNRDRAINELFFSCTKYIRNTCYGHKGKRPSIVILGQTGRAYSFAATAKKNIRVKRVLEACRKLDLDEIGAAVSNKRLDGVILLSNAKHKKSVFKYLIKQGLKLNENLFEFWVWC